MTKDAYALAEFAHRQQVRQTLEGPVPYITHPLRVALKAKRWVKPEHKDVVGTIGLLHDVVEDQRERMEAAFGRPVYAILCEKFGPIVAGTVRRLTNDPDVPYLDHVAANLENPLFVVVKLADFDDNALSLQREHPRYMKLRAKYAPLVPLVRAALRRGDVQQLLRDPLRLADHIDARVALAGFDLHGE